MSTDASVRTAALKEAFGSQGPAFGDLLNDIAKVNFDAYKTKVESLAVVQDKLSALAKKVPKFWFTSLTRCPGLGPFLDPADADALAHLTDVKIFHDAKDVRDFVIEFHFSAKNPFFSNTVLKKSLTVTPPKGTPAPSAYDLDADLYTSAADPIKWTSPEHDLTKKAPRPKMEEIEEFDSFDGVGSFFCWFAESGRDGMGIGESVLEWKGNAVEYAAGMVEDMDDGSDGGLPSDDDDDDSEDDDPTKEVDLESEDDRPKKKPKKA